MINASAEYLTKINSKARKLYSEITVNYTDTTLDTSSVGSSTDLNYISYPQQMVNGRTAMSYKYCELDGQMILDGSFKLCPDTDTSANFNEIGWWSASRADATGVVDASAQIEYTARSVSGYLLACDDKLNEYAVDFNAKFYDGATLVYTDTVTGNTEVSLQRSFTQITDIDKVVLNVTKWSEPNTVVKIAEFTTQVIEKYTDEILCQWNVLEEREISNDNSIPVGNISSNQASFCLVNGEGRPFDANNITSRLHGLIKPNAFVEIALGVDTVSGIEYQPIFKGWCTEWDVPESNKKASSTARDRLDLLRQTKITTSNVIEDYTFSQWFEVVLNNAGLSASQYNIDTTFTGSAYIVPYGWFSAVTHRNALEQLSKACSGTVYVDRDGIIQIKALDSFDSGSVQTITRSDYTDKDNQPIYQNVVNNISVTTSPLVKTIGVTVYETGSTDPEEIEASTTTNYTIIFSESPVSDITTLDVNPTVSGVTVSSYTAYSWGASVNVTNTNGTAQDFQLRAIGSTYEVVGQKTVTRTDTASIEANGEVSFSYSTSTFLQSKALATTIAENLLASFKDAQRDLSLSFDVGGNPMIELGDTITVTDLYMNKDYKIISQDISYNGSVSMTQRGRL